MKNHSLHRALILAGLLNTLAKVSIAAHDSLTTVVIPSGTPLGHGRP